MTGSVLYGNKLDKEKRSQCIKGIETAIPTSKTASLDQYNSHVKYMLSNMRPLFDFYNKQRAEGKFRLFQGRQWAKENMVNMIINGDTKYNKKRRKNTRKNRKRRMKSKEVRDQKKENKKGKEVLKWVPNKFKEDKDRISLVVFGSGMFGKDLVRLKGNRCGITGLLWRTLKKRGKETKTLLVITIDEFRTSKIYSHCGKADMFTPSVIPGHGVLKCNYRKIIWNRDVIAAKNMKIISQSI